MTHLYCRATRSVSIVPPVYYAHLAAARGELPFLTRPYSLFVGPSCCYVILPDARCSLGFLLHFHRSSSCPRFNE